MTKTISKPDANPILAAVLTAFVLGLGHLIVNGQQRKWMMTLVGGIVGSIACCIPGMVIGILSIVDSYQTAERLKNGESIPENEYSNALLYKMIKIIDKSATCASAPTA